MHANRDPHPGGMLLTQVLELISERYQVIFSYDSKLLSDIEVDFELQREEHLETVVNRVLSDTGLKYKHLSEKYYVIFQDSRSGHQKAKKLERKIQQIQKLEQSNEILVQRSSAGSSKRLHTIFQSANALIAAVTVQGKVTDENGEPLIGVNILVKGTSQGTITDLDGNFSLDLADGKEVLIFSYTGYEPVEVAVNGRSTLQVSMAESVSQLDEIVVVGYASLKKSDLTGSVASVREDDLTAYPATDLVQAMQGRAAGVTVQAVNGEPGSSFKIRVRGATSINASSEPLFVVDGFVGGVLPPPEDIASIEILKDASATAIYGSRGANGVVMITTKSGKSGKVRINLSSSYSGQKEIGRLDLLNARQFAEYINEARNTNFFDLDQLDTDTDWQDLIFRPGYIQNHQLSVSGGSDKVQYYVSGVYFEQKGVIKTSAFNRYSLLTNLKFSVSDHVRISLNSTYQGSTQDGVLTQTGGGVTNAGAVTAAQRFDPNQNILDENGRYTLSRVGIAAFENPMAVINGREEENIQENIQLNIKAEIDIARGLVFNSTFGTIIRNQRNGTYNNRISNLGEGTNGSGSLAYLKNTNALTEQYLNYDFQLGEKNGFVLTGGYSYQNFNGESFTAANSGFLTDALSIIGQDFFHFLCAQ